MLAVTGLSMIVSILGVGIICTFYTTVVRISSARGMGNQLRLCFKLLINLLAQAVKRTTKCDKLAIIKDDSQVVRLRSDSARKAIRFQT